MCSIAFASGNVGKVNSVIAAGKRFGITIVHHIPHPELIEIQDESYANVAAFKVKQVRYQLKGSAFCIDGGFGIDGLNGWPGTMTKQTLEQIGNDRFLRVMSQESLMQGVVRNALAYLDSSLTTPVVFEDSIPGTLILEGRGRVNPAHQWSSLWHHFVPFGTLFTFAELEDNPEAQMQWHRTRDTGHSIYSQFFTWLKEVHWRMREDE
jgi:inosine/xanthosine triphosphate pyrophosphatase family protein